MYPPMLLYLRIGAPDRPGHGVWLPLFLVWLILLPLLVFILAVTLMVDVVLLLTGDRYHHYTLLFLRCLGLIGDLKGTVMHIHSKDTNVDIDLV
jgi:hypothetical protein